MLPAQAIQMTSLEEREALSLTAWIEQKQSTDGLVYSRQIQVRSDVGR